MSLNTVDPAEVEFRAKFTLDDAKQFLAAKGDPYMDPPPAPVAPATKEPTHIPTGLRARTMYLNEHQKEKAVWEEWDKYREAQAAYEAEMNEWMVEDLAYRERVQRVLEEEHEAERELWLRRCSKEQQGPVQQEQAEHSHRKNNKKWDKEAREKKKNMKTTGMRSAAAAAKEQARHDEVEEMAVGLEEALLREEEKQSQVVASEAKPGKSPRTRPHPRPVPVPITVNVETLKEVKGVVPTLQDQMGDIQKEVAFLRQDVRRLGRALQDSHGKIMELLQVNTAKSDLESDSSRMDQDL